MIKILGSRRIRARLRTINLREPPESRWNRALRHDRGAAKKLIRQADAVLHQNIPKWLLHPAKKIISATYRMREWWHADEIMAISELVGLDFETVCTLQCVYELSHFYRRGASIIGCTAGIVEDPGMGMIHLRNLDWGLPAIRSATRIIRFTNGKREHVVVGIAGFVGALSGMVPGAYSASINYAPPSDFPGAGSSPAFLLRHVLENCDTFDEAVRVLKKTPLTTPAFFTLCGGDGAMTIERTRNEYAVVRMKDGILVQANHHNSPVYREMNCALEDYRSQYSEARQSCMRAKLLDGRAGLRAWTAVLRSFPIRNEITQQRMIFRPSHGEVWLADE